jgi:peptide/nickel transport system permease protein
MLAYAARRLAQVIPTLIGLTFLSFLIIHVVPGDPGRIALGMRASPAAVVAFDRHLGLDKPLLAQYWTFVTDAVRFHLGASISRDQSVASVIVGHAGLTVLLVAYATIVALVIAVPASIAVAVRPNSLIDHAVRALGMIAFVMPAFWFGILLILVFAVNIPLFPVTGYGSGVGGVLRSLTLPAFTLGLAVAPLFIRTLRASLISTLNASFIDAARARGFSARRVLYRHALRPSCTSLVTLVGLTVGWLIGGTVVVEAVFGLPGLGTVLTSSVEARDFPLVQGLVLVLGTAVIVINLVTDLTYAVVDPRIRLGARQ